MSRLDSALAGKRVVICAGAGGVGKTTVSAIVALGLAAQGRRVALVTIDPARRLAEALGLDALGNRPQVVDVARFGESGVEIEGELAAMMLDAKRTFDELIGLLASTPATRDEILGNPIYEHISTAVAGSQEYTAIAKLYELEHSSDHDVIVLDTPPSRHAIDFLEAPDRLVEFLEGRALGAFLRPTGRAIQAAGVAFAALRRITGTGLLDDLTSLFRLLGEMLDGFHRRAADVHELLTDPASAFLIVTSPERAALEEARFLAAELDRAGMHCAGVIVNRAHPLDPTDPDVASTAARLAPVLGSSLAKRTAITHAEVQRLARRGRGRHRTAALGTARGACHPGRSTVGRARHTRARGAARGAVRARRWIGCGHDDASKPAPIDLRRPPLRFEPADRGGRRWLSGRPRCGGTRLDAGTGDRRRAAAGGGSSRAARRPPGGDRLDGHAQTGRGGAPPDPRRVCAWCSRRGGDGLVGAARARARGGPRAPQPAGHGFQPPRSRGSRSDRQAHTAAAVPFPLRAGGRAAGPRRCTRTPFVTRRGWLRRI